jgi:hypothetical protein
MGNLIHDLSCVRAASNRSKTKHPQPRGSPAIDAHPSPRADAPDVWFRREARSDGKSIDPRGRELQPSAAAEGATAPETLRQKGRGSDDNAGKRRISRPPTE